MNVFSFINSPSLILPEVSMMKFNSNIPSHGVVVVVGVVDVVLVEVVVVVGVVVVEVVEVVEVLVEVVVGVVVLVVVVVGVVVVEVVEVVVVGVVVLVVVVVGVVVVEVVDEVVVVGVVVVEVVEDVEVDVVVGVVVLVVVVVGVVVVEVVDEVVVVGVVVLVVVVVGVVVVEVVEEVEVDVVVVGVVVLVVVVVGVVVVEVVDEVVVVGVVVVVVVGVVVVDVVEVVVVGVVVLVVVVVGVVVVEVVDEVVVVGVVVVVVVGVVVVDVVEVVVVVGVVVVVVVGVVVVDVVDVVVVVGVVVVVVVGVVVVEVLVVVVGVGVVVVDVVEVVLVEVVLVELVLVVVVVVVTHTACARSLAKLAKSSKSVTSRTRSWEPAISSSSVGEVKEPIPMESIVVPFARAASAEARVCDALLDFPSVSTTITLGELSRPWSSSSSCARSIPFAVSVPPPACVTSLTAAFTAARDSWVKRSNSRLTNVANCTRPTCMFSSDTCNMFTTSRMNCLSRMKSSGLMLPEPSNTNTRSSSPKHSRGASVMGLHAATKISSVLAASPSASSTIKTLVRSGPVAISRSSVSSTFSPTPTAISVMPLSFVACASSAVCVGSFDNPSVTATPTQGVDCWIAGRSMHISRIFWRPRCVLVPSLNCSVSRMSRIADSLLLCLLKSNSTLASLE